jgi:hypothetical protein
MLVYCKTQNQSAGLLKTANKTVLLDRPLRKYMCKQYEHDNATYHENLSYNNFYLADAAPGFVVGASSFTLLVNKFRDCWQSYEMPKVDAVRLFRLDEIAILCRC